MTLRDRLDDIARRADERLPPDLQRALDDLLRDFAAKEIAPGSLRAGDEFPDFDLPDSEGHLVSRAQLLAAGPLVLSFFRGDWCPYCTAELRAYQDVLPQLATLGASLVAVTPDTREPFAATGRRHGLGYRVLSDVDHGLALACGILFNLPDPVRRMYREIGIDLAERHGNSGAFLPFPATYIIDRAGIVRHAEINPDFRQRLEPEQVLARLGAL